MPRWDWKRELAEAIERERAMLAAMSEGERLAWEAERDRRQAEFTDRMRRIYQRKPGDAPDLLQCVAPRRKV